MHLTSTSSTSAPIPIGVQALRNSLLCKSDFEVLPSFNARMMWHCAEWLCRANANFEAVSVAVSVAAQQALLNAGKTGTGLWMPASRRLHSRSSSPQPERTSGWSSSSKVGSRLLCPPPPHEWMGGCKPVPSPGEQGSLTGRAPRTACTR